MLRDSNGTQVDRAWIAQKAIDLFETTKDDVMRLKCLEILGKSLFDKAAQDGAKSADGIDAQLREARDAVQKRATREKKPS